MLFYTKKETTIYNRLVLFSAYIMYYFFCTLSFYLLKSAHHYTIRTLLLFYTMSYAVYFAFTCWFRDVLSIHALLYHYVSFLCVFTNDNINNKLSIALIVICILVWILIIRGFYAFEPYYINNG